MEVEPLVSEEEAEEEEEEGGEGEDGACMHCGDTGLLPKRLKKVNTHIYHMQSRTHKQTYQKTRRRRKSPGPHTCARTPHSHMQSSHTFSV